MVCTVSLNLKNILWGIFETEAINEGIIAVIRYTCDLGSCNTMRLIYEVKPLIQWVFYVIQFKTNVEYSCNTLGDCYPVFCGNVLHQYSTKYYAELLYYGNVVI